MCNLMYIIYAGKSISIFIEIKLKKKMYEVNFILFMLWILFIFIYFYLLNLLRPHRRIRRAEALNE